MRACEFLKEDTAPAQAWIDRVYAKYPGTWQNNHVIIYGEGEEQAFAAFELKAVDTKTVDIVWLQAYPQRQGIGSKALAELQALARADGITLTLIPWAHGRVSPASLTKFYKRSGFKPRAKGARNMVWTPEMNESETIPSVSFKQLYHVGKLDAGLKREHSYEGAGLSVSTHPEAWREIGRGAVVGDTYTVTKPNNAFLAAHKLTKSAKSIIANWAVEQGLLEPKETIRVSWFDDELNNTMYQEFPSMEEAENEFGDLDGYDISRNNNGYLPTNKLKQISKNPNMSATGVLDYVLPIYAESQGYDGVWWQDKLDVNKYSAPRGVIVPNKISTWTIQQ